MGSVLSLFLDKQKLFSSISPEQLGFNNLGVSRLLPFRFMTFVFHPFIIPWTLFEIFLHCVLALNLISACFIILIEHLFVCLLIIHSLYVSHQGQLGNDVILLIFTKFTDIWLSLPSSPTGMMLVIQDLQCQCCCRCQFKVL